MENRKAAERVACLYLLSHESGRIQPVEALRALAEACFRFTPQVALRESQADDAIFLEISGCDRLYSEEGLALRLVALARRFGWQSRVRVSGDAGAALALARYPETRNVRALPLGALADFASPFEFVADSQKKVSELICLLKMLGVQTLGEFVAFPAETLASRFGKRAVELSARISREKRPAWPGFHPVPNILEREELGELAALATGLEPLLFHVRGSIDRAMARLRGRGERAGAIELRFKLESWSTTLGRPVRSWRIAFPWAQSSVAGVLPIIEEQLHRSLEREPLTAPVQAVEFEITETSPGAGAQRDFFSRKEQEAEACRALLARLAHRLGQEQVFYARPQERYLPEQAYVRASEPMRMNVAEVEAAVAYLPERPARVLLRPEEIRQVGQALVHRTGKRWQVRGWEGPERISGEWWGESSAVAGAAGNASAANAAAAAAAVATTPGLTRDSLPSYATPRTTPRVMRSVPSAAPAPSLSPAPAKAAAASAACAEAPARPPGFDRDYYRIVTENGERLWVFVNRHAVTGCVESLIPWRNPSEAPASGASVADIAQARALPIQPALYLHGFFD